MDSVASTAEPKKAGDTATARETISITDNRTANPTKSHHPAPSAHGPSPDQSDANDFGMMSYDPAFNNTASCISRVSYIDGDKGILRYRGYPSKSSRKKALI